MRVGKWSRWIFLAGFFGFSVTTVQGSNFLVNAQTPFQVTPDYFSTPPAGGDTIFISAQRKMAVVFDHFNGNSSAPVVIMNRGGQVAINDTVHYAGIQLHDCHFIKLTGSGAPPVRYGFHLKAVGAGVFLSGLSSDIELSYIAIDYDGFMGIQAKKDYHGFPPSPIPVFRNLVIHDCFIQHVSEGMYIGETKTPGMEFKHIRIFNNVVTHTKREAIQLANAVGDVEVYNNLMFDNGVAKLYSQSNNTQMGDNTVGDYYNNIISGANEHGIVVLGSGHIRVYSNYIANNEGMFIDNRSVTDPLAAISVTGNYFYHITADEVVRNYNELNPILLKNNYFNTPIPFYRSNCTDCTNATLENNQETNVPVLKFTVVNGTYVPDPENPRIYKHYGPQSGLGYAFNSWPVFPNLQNITVNFGDSLHAVIRATVTDGDSIAMDISGLPSFVKMEPEGNGVLVLRGYAKSTEKGIYPLVVNATEQSNGIAVKKAFNLIVRNPSNKSPVITVRQNLRVRNLKKQFFNVTVTDPEHDRVQLTPVNPPPFVHLTRVNDSIYTLEVQPLYQDAGHYAFTLNAQDGYGGVTRDTLHLWVQQTPPEPGLVIYRENFGGPDLPGTPIDWEGVDAASTQFISDKVYATGSHSWHGFNSTSAPDNLFGPFFYGTSDTEKLHFHFPCAPGTYEVKLFYTDRQMDFDSNGPVIMNVLAQDSLMAKSFNVSDGLIDTAIEQRFQVTVQDSSLNITLEPVKNAAKICGAEIIVADRDRSAGHHEDWVVFPNPFHTRIHITNHQSDPVVSWSLHDITGRLIMTKSLENSSYEPDIRLNFPPLRKGVYLLQIKTQNEHSTLKIVKF